MRFGNTILTEDFLAYLTICEDKILSSHIVRYARKSSVRIVFPNLIAKIGGVTAMGYALAVYQHLIVNNVKILYVQIVCRNVINVGEEFVTAVTMMVIGFVHVPTVIGPYATNAARCNTVKHTKIAFQLFAMIANLKIGNVRGVATSMIITTIMIRQK